MHDKVLHTLNTVGHLQLECFQTVVDVYFTSRNGKKKKKVLFTSFLDRGMLLWHKQVI